MNPTESIVSKNIQQIRGGVWNMKELAGMFLFTSLFYLALGTLALRFLWLIKMGSFAHWSYLVGNYFYPKDIHGSTIVGAVVFAVLTLGSTVPTNLFPKTKCLISALNIAPQIHMFSLLHHGIGQTIKNDSLKKVILFYTVLSIICTVWSTLNLFRLVAQLE